MKKIVRATFLVYRTHSLVGLHSAPWPALLCSCLFIFNPAIIFLVVLA